MSGREPTCSESPYLAIRFGMTGKSFGAALKGVWSDGRLLRRLVETLATEAEHAIGSRPIILPGNSRSQLHQLRRRKTLLQAFSQFRRYARGCSRDRVSKLQYQLLVSIKQITLGIPVQISDLIVRDPDPSAPGRVDVDSKRTFDEFGSANLAQLLELGRYKMSLVESLAELRVSNEIVRMCGRRCQWGNVPAETLARHPPDDCDLKFRKHTD
jgi:hypothetical protein